MNSKTRLTLARIAALVIDVGLTIFIFINRDNASALAAHGYPGIFLIALMAHATVLLPAPGLAFVFTMGAVFHPVGVALAAGAGATLGEISGYLTGFSGQAVIENIKLYQRMSMWMQKNGPLTVLLLAAVPNPVFDLAGVTAGALKMPLPIFLFWCFLGQVIKMFVFSIIGSSSLNYILK